MPALFSSSSGEAAAGSPQEGQHGAVQGPWFCEELPLALLAPGLDFPNLSELWFNLCGGWSFLIGIMQRINQNLLCMTLSRHAPLCFHPRAFWGGTRMLGQSVNKGISQGTQASGFKPYPGVL